MTTHITEEQMEAFSSDLVALFNKHHLAILWEPDNLVEIEQGAHVDFIGMMQMDDGRNLIYPACSKVNLDDLIHLEDDKDGPKI